MSKLKVYYCIMTLIFRKSHTNNNHNAGTILAVGSWKSEVTPLVPSYPFLRYSAVQYMSRPRDHGRRLPEIPRRLSGGRGTGRRREAGRGAQHDYTSKLVICVTIQMFSNPLILYRKFVIISITINF